MKLRGCVLGLSLAALLGACGQREVILPGPRLDLRAPLSGDAAASAAAPQADVAAPIALPAPVVNAAWPQKSGGPDHSIRHPALNLPLTRVWSAEIGKGNSRRHRITADPVVANGRVFTLDSRARVSAHTADGGAPIWSRDLTPPADRMGDASGGGLAVAGGRLYVTSAFGTLTALDATTGATVWRQELEAAATGAPTVSGGRVFVAARDARGWAIDAANGRIAWRLSGIAGDAGITGGAAPAVVGNLAVYAFSSGELVGVDADSGARRFQSSVAGQRLGRVYAAISDVTGDPVISGGVIYAGALSGRATAIDAGTGERLWNAEEGALSPVWVTGGSVFLVSDRNELIRLDAATGARVWGTELPLYTARRERRRKAVFAHYGPILAGGRLVIASNDGLIRVFSAQSGRLAATAPVPGGAASNPVVAAGTLYVLGADGTLHAYR